MRPQRIIIGGAGPAELELLRELYLPFSRNREKLMAMDARSAELSNCAEAEGFEPQLLRAVASVNARQKHRLFAKIARHYPDGLRGKVFALWGLSFKPDTNDIREASSRVLLEALWNAGAQVQAHDPQAMGEIQRHYGERLDLECVPQLLADRVV